MQTVLVTGGTGFVGTRLVNALCKSGYQVKILARNTNFKSDHANVSVCYGDICNAEDVVAAVAGVEVVFHLAAAMSGDEETHKQVTIGGTHNIIEACKANNTSHLIYVSTLNVYDASLYRNGEGVAEDFPYESRSEWRGFYSNAKLQAEKALLAAQDELPSKITIFRPGLIYGNKNNLLPLDVAIKISGSIYGMIGWGKRRLSFVNVENLVEAMILPIKAQQEKLDIFNIVDDEQPTQKEYIKIYNRHSADKVHWIPVPLAFVKTAFFTADRLFQILGRNKHLIFRLSALTGSPVFDASHAKNQLGWQPRLNLEEGVKDAISRT